MKQADATRPDGSELSAELGPLPPADLTLPSIAPDSPDGAHFYRASTVLRLLAAEREWCAAKVRSLKPGSSWCPDSDADANAEALEEAARAIEGPNYKHERTATDDR